MVEQYSVSESNTQARKSQTRKPGFWKLFSDGHEEPFVKSGEAATGVGRNEYVINKPPKVYSPTAIQTFDSSET